MPFEKAIRAAQPRRHFTFLAAPAAAAVMVAAAIATAPTAASAAAAGGQRVRSACSRPDPVRVPPYYLTITGAIKSTATGARITRVRPPKPYNTIEAITGAADDRTFVLAAQTGTQEGYGAARLFIARFNPADRAATLRALPTPTIPAADLLTGLALSPNGRLLATAVLTGKNRTDSVLTVYSLAGRPAKVWRADGTIGSSLYDSAAISWSCTGTMAVNFFTGRIAGSGVWLLNTRTRGGRLLAASRLVLPLVNPSDTAFAFAWDGVLTPNGKRIVAPMWRLAASSPGQASSTDQFEEFSARTGKPVRVLYRESGTNPSVDEALEWTNTSGRVLVVGALARGAKQPVIGILRGPEFRPIPGAPADNGSEVVIVF
jgi:hypothetical protein